MKNAVSLALAVALASGSMLAQAYQAGDLILRLLPTMTVTISRYQLIPLLFYVAWKLMMTLSLALFLP
jgi:hypothetical protein